MQTDDLPPDLALALLLNSRELLARLPEPAGDPAVIDEIRSALLAIPEERVASLAPPLVALLLEAEPTLRRELDTLAERQPTRGVDSDPSMIAGLWEAIKADIGYVALLVLFLRTLGYNRIKTKILEYEGRSIFEELRALIRPADTTSPSSRKKK